MIATIWDKPNVGAPELSVFIKGIQLYNVVPPQL